MRSKKQLAQAPTFESILADLKETGKLMRANAKETKEMKRETREMKKSLEQMYAESRRETKELNRQLGGISNSNGDMAETYFYNAFKVSRIFAGEKFDQIQQNTKGSNGEVEAEFDLILFNGKSVAIIEVKYKAKPDNISVKRLIARVSKFKILYPAYQNHYIYLGVAALTFGTGMEERLRRNGIATIHQIGKKMVIYDQDLKTF